MAKNIKNIVMASALNTELQDALYNRTHTIVNQLSKKYRFDEEEALRFILVGKNLMYNIRMDTIVTMMDNNNEYNNSELINSNSTHLPDIDPLTNLEDIQNDHSQCNKLTQSQSHGFIWELQVKRKVFDIKTSSNNDTNVHDIPSLQNKFNKNEEVGIKVIGGKIIYCSDIARFFTYDFEKQNTIIVIQYNQDGKFKVINKIYEIDYNKKCHDLLFGNLPLKEITNYTNNVKSIPKKTKGDDAKAIFDYLDEKEELDKTYNFNIQINPKVDSSQSRVQCSIPNFTTLLKEFIVYESDIHKPNIIRGKEIDRTIYSPKRQRGGIKKDELQQLCKDNSIKFNYKLKKQQLIDLLNSHNVTIPKSY